MSGVRISLPRPIFSVSSFSLLQANDLMVGVAQLVERRIVIPVVAGSIPVVHPIIPL